MRAVVYCRVSTVEQAQNLSLPTQEAACRAYCAQQGYRVDRVFVDAGESAKTTDRPAFIDLLSYCRQHKGALHTVVVYSLTRFSRNNADHHSIAALLRGLGIALRSVTEPIDDSPAGKLMEAILAGFAQFDNDVRAQRVTAGMKAAASRGRWVWVAPIGYLNSNVRSGPSLLPDPATAPAVRQAFEWAAEGIIGRELLTRVRAAGLTSKHGRRLAMGQLYAILRHPVYTGTLRTESFGIDTKGDFEPIVQGELFARVQCRLSQPNEEQRTRRRHVDHPDFPLRRFVRCGACDRAMTGSWSTGRGGKRYAFYHCEQGCERVKRDDMHDAYISLMHALRPRQAYWQWLKIKVLELWRTRRADAVTARAQRQRRVTKLEHMLDRLSHVFIFDQMIDEGTYRRKRDDLREQLTVAKMELSQAEIDETDIEGLVAFAEYALMNAGALWTAAAALNERLRVQWTMFPTGLRWKSGEFMEPLNVLTYYDLETRATGDHEVVNHPTPTWKRVVEFLQHISQLQARAA